MNEKQFLVESSYLATKNNPEDRDLLCGKIEFLPDCFVFYIIELINPLRDSKISKKILQVIQNKAKTTEDGLSVDDFEILLKSINEGLSRLSEVDDTWLGNLNAVLGLIDGTDIAISQSGKITGYIFRHNKIQTLTEKSNEEIIPHPLKTFSDIITGNLAEDDQIIFGNEDLYTRVSLDRLRDLTKLNSAGEEALELAKHLKKAHALLANAVIIGTVAHDSASSPEIPEVIFIDESADNFKIFLDKYALPFLDLVKKYSLIIAKFLFKKSKEIAQKSHAEWQRNYGPKTRELMRRGSEKIKKSWEESRQRNKAVVIEDQESLHRLRIKAVPYSRKEKHPLVKTILRYMQYLTRVKVVFKKKNLKYLYAILIALILLFAYAKIRINNEKRAEKTEEIETLNAYDKAVETFDKAKSDLSLGKTTDLTDLYTALSLAKQAEQAEANKDKAITLEKEINVMIDDRIKAVRYYEPISYDLAEKTEKIILVGSEIYGLTSEGKIYVVDTRDQESRLVGSIGKDYGDIVNIGYTDSLKKLLILTSQNRLLALDLTTKVVEELKTANDDSLWEEANALAVYSSNIYLLGSESGEVWKHTSQENIYSKGSTYADTRNVSLRGAVDMAVDGNIYILQNDGLVLKFVKGAWEQDFTVRNIPAPDNQILIPAQIVTSEDTNNIFVLDKKANRIVKFDKSGEYVNQYVFDGITIERFVVNAKLQKIWALSGGKIYEGNL